MKKKKEIMLLVVGLVCLVLITVGVTYAFFNYAKEGTTDNTITTGTITFLYTEISEVGRGISIEDAYPVSDSVGKAQTGEGKVFDFKVTSNTPNSSSISYEVTARKKDTSDLSEEAVKLYLTKVTGTSEEEIILAKYSELTTTDKVDSSKYNEKTLYKGKVPANTIGYEQAFRLRLWIDEKIDFSDGSMNDKEFTVTVNVYANAKVVTADEEALLASTDITSIEVDGEPATLVTGQAYDYEVELSSRKDSALVRVTTLNQYASVEVVKIDSLAYNTSVKRLSASKAVDLTSGDNYFKITVTSENKENTKDYKLKVVVPKDTDNTLSSLSLTGCILDPAFSSNTTSYTCTTSKSNTTVSAITTSSLATIEGLGEKALVTGDNTVEIKVTSESGLEKVYTVIVTKEGIPLAPDTPLTIGTSVTAIDGSKWHVLEDSGVDSEIVVLLSDYNLNTDGGYNTECGKDINGITSCSNIKFDDSSSDNVYDATDSNNIGYFIKNTYEPLVTAALPGTTNVTIPTAYQIAVADNQTFNDSVITLTTPWLITTQYWTKSSFGSNKVWRVISGTINNLYGNTAQVGARPVITTLKSNLIAE